MSASRVALVTGANKGIGYHVVEQLAKSDSTLTVLLGSRDIQRGEEAVKQINLPNVKSIQLEVTDDKSVAQAFDEVKTKYGGLDILVNNAGIYHPKDTNGDETAMDQTLLVNYYSPLKLIQTFQSIIKPNGRIVNVASALGRQAISGMGDQLKDKFKKANSIESLNSYVTEFRNGSIESKGKFGEWPASVYGVSKAALIVASKILSQQQTNGVTVFSACPGFCITDMTKGLSPPRTATEGGSMIVHPLLIDQSEAIKLNGKFFENKAVSEWE